MGVIETARKIKGKRFEYWKHPTAKGKYVKARRYKNGKLKIVGTVPASQVPGLKKSKKRRRK